MIRRLHLGLLRVYRLLPARGRRLAVRAIAPKYTVGTVCVIERDDAAILLVRHTYRERWGTPGGLLKRGEDAAAAVKREVREEVGLEVDLAGEPSVVVDAERQRIDIVFRARPAAGSAPDDATPVSVEIAEARWFAPSALPELQFETSGALVSVARARQPADASKRR